MFQELRTAFYRVPDLDRAKAWYSAVTGQSPYFDEPFYVGFNVGGYELGLIPDGEGAATYWGVADIEVAVQQLLTLGATLQEPIRDVGEGILTATVLDPFGNSLGVIYNPHFSA